MSSAESLTKKQKELIAVAASVAAGCVPCTAHHVKEARTADATDDEIRAAVDDALTVRSRATDQMWYAAMTHLGVEGGLQGGQHTLQPLLRELTSVAAAFAVNSANELAVHLDAARVAGASDRQLELTLALTRTVKKVAAGKAEAVVADPSKPAVQASVPD